MSYLVLARKYRPQGFDELVGQEHVTRTLINALESKRVGHAYIFSGPRGCGKTTSARILAKALNCVKGPTPTPCNACAACKEIAEGASADDVLEIDGASNRGIEQIREIRDTIKYAPARSRYRIVIIDEAHQITDAGFNALLKTLEEPPPHAVFMMATTESQKIPTTILSRCQRFQLKSIAPADTVAQLKKILAAEKVTAEDAALFEVARAAHGGLRDALSLLDQVISYAPDGVTVKNIRDLLGLLPREKVREFAAVLREGSPEKTLQAIQKAVDEGFELGQLAQNLLDHFHEILLWKNGVRAAESADPAALDKEAALYAEEDVERSLSILSQAADRLRRSESPRVTFELACLDLSRKTLPLDELLDRLEALEAGLSGNGAGPSLVKKKSDLAPAFPSPAQAGESARRTDEGTKSLRNGFSQNTTPPHPASGHPQAPPSPPIPVGEAFLASSPLSLERAREVPPARPATIAVPASPRIEVPPSPESPVPPRAVTLSAWPRVVEAVGVQKPSIESFVAAARPVLSPDGALRLLCASDFQRTQIAAHLPLLTALVQKEIGPVPVSCAVEAGPANARPAPAAPPAPAAAASASSEDAEVVSDEDESAPAPDDEEDPGPATPPPALAARETAVNVADLAALEPGLKKVLDKFPGKLKKIEPTPS